MRIRWQMRRLLAIWLRRYIDRRTDPTNDLVTLQPIIQPVHVYDFPRRRCFSFEAKTCAQAIQAALSHGRDGFSQPLEPKNLYTNRPFTYVQLVAIGNQLKVYGLEPWLLAAYREHDFRLTYYARMIHTTLTTRAIKSELRTDSEYSHDMIIGFIEGMLYDCEIPNSAYITKVLKAALEVVPDHPLIGTFRLLTYVDYEADILGQDSNLFLLYTTKCLFDKIGVLEKIPAIAAKLL